MPSAGSTTARGYGGKHQAEREAWVPKVKAGGVHCRRCGRPIHPDAPFDLGHDDYDRSLPRHPEHRKCNRGAPRRRAKQAKQSSAAPALRFFETDDLTPSPQS